VRDVGVGDRVVQGRAVARGRVDDAGHDHLVATDPAAVLDPELRAERIGDAPAGERGLELDGDAAGGELAAVPLDREAVLVLQLVRVLHGPVGLDVEGQSNLACLALGIEHLRGQLGVAGAVGLRHRHRIGPHRDRLLGRRLHARDPHEVVRVTLLLAAAAGALALRLRVVARPTADAADQQEDHEPRRRRQPAAARTTHAGSLPHPGSATRSGLTTLRTSFRL
jgi:hypothetical protein